MGSKTAMQHLIENLTRLNAFEMGIYIRDNKHRFLYMEKQQLMEAYKASDDSYINDESYDSLSTKDAEQYYNETYGK